MERVRYHEARDNEKGIDAEPTKGARNTDEIPRIGVGQVKPGNRERGKAP